MVLALIKLGQRWPWVRACLERHQLLEGSLFAQRVGWPDQVLARAIEIPAESKPYFSLLLIRQTWPEVLP
jgi:precorrin-2/cobalt-factor-2 C20-methyltransferase